MVRAWQLIDPDLSCSPAWRNRQPYYRAVGIPTSRPRGRSSLEAKQQSEMALRHLATASSSELRVGCRRYRRLFSTHHACASTCTRTRLHAARHNNQFGIIRACGSSSRRGCIGVTQSKFLAELPVQSFRSSSRKYSATVLRQAEHGKRQSQSQSAPPPPPAKASEISNMPQPSIKDDVLFWTGTMFRILAGMGIAHCVDEYCFRLTHTEGPSMLPTIKTHGEIILMERFSYRIRGLEDGDKGQERSRLARLRQLEWETSPSYHRTDMPPTSGDDNHDKEQEDDDDGKNDNKPTWHKRRPFQVSHPSNSTYERWWNQLTSPLSVGDIVVVQRPGRAGTVCKRILGLPGDIVVMPRGVKSRYLVTETTMREKAEIVMENMMASNRGNPSTWPTASFDGSVPFTQNQIRIVPDGNIWLEGDNSLESVDSRSYGPVPAGLIVGRVVCRVWPLRGKALLGRGDRPSEKGRSFNGSIVFPAGYEGERILAAE